MNSLVRFFLISFAILSLSACGMKYQSHGEGLQVYVGSSIEELVTAFGAPRNTTKLPGGKTVYSFVTSTTKQQKTAEIREESRYGYSSYDPDEKTTSVYQNVQVKCEITATTDNQGIVQMINSRGEGCEGRWIKNDNA